MIRGVHHFGFKDDVRSPTMMGVLETLGKRLDGRRRIA
jgi:hypothetical protein